MKWKILTTYNENKRNSMNKAVWSFGRFDLFFFGRNLSQKPKFLVHLENYRNWNRKHFRKSLEYMWVNTNHCEIRKQSYTPYSVLYNYFTKWSNFPDTDVTCCLKMFFFFHFSIGLLVNEPKCMLFRAILSQIFFKNGPTLRLMPVSDFL